MTMFETADMSEMEIRDAFGFTKTKPIVFKERGEDGQTIKTLSVSSMKLIRLDTDGKMGSLANTLEDGRELRICSAYLKEMQAARFTFETKVDDEEWQGSRRFRLFSFFYSSRCLVGGSLVALPGGGAARVGW